MDIFSGFHYDPITRRLLHVDQSALFQKSDILSGEPLFTLALRAIYSNKKCTPAVPMTGLTGVHVCSQQISGCLFKCNGLMLFFVICKKGLQAMIRNIIKRSYFTYIRNTGHHLTMFPPDFSTSCHTDSFSCFLLR